MIREVRTGVARALSKRGLCSRTQAQAWVRDGRVRVDGRVVRDPEHPTTAASRIDVDGAPVGDTPARVVIALNKPRGLVTTARDEQGRDTVYACLAGADLPWLAPVGRLDKASEGLLLMTNDPAWAAHITDPSTGPSKTYHVQVTPPPTTEALTQIRAGIECDGERLAVACAGVLRTGTRNAWLEIVLHEGRNRQIRRLLAAVDVDVQRLVRVGIGALALGALAKGQWRVLDADDVARIHADEAPAANATIPR